MGKARVIDWDGLEPHYRAGIRSLKDIGAEFDVSDAAILKKAKRDGWTRDLSAKIKAKADAKVSAAAVSAEVSAAKALTEKSVVEANAEMQYRIRIGHRTDIARVKNLLMTLLSEAEHQGTNVELYQELGELLAKPDDKGMDKLGDIYRKAMSMPSRVGVLKQITETLAILIKLEREAFGIAVKSDDLGGSGGTVIQLATPDELRRALRGG